MSKDHVEQVSKHMKELEQHLINEAENFWKDKKVTQELKDDSVVNAAVRLFKLSVARQVLNRMPDVEDDELESIKNAVGDICVTLQAEIWRELKQKHKKIIVPR